MIGNTEAVGTVRHFQVAVRGVVVADQGSAIRADRNRRELADIVPALDSRVGDRFTANIGAASDS